MRTRSTSHRLLALVLCVSTTACATAGGHRVQPAQQPVNPALLAEYVQKLPLGETVRVDRLTGATVRGTLMKATAELVVLQPRTRVPVPPVEIPLTDVARIAPDNGGGTSIAKAIGAGVAAGAAGALAVFFILVAIYAD